MVDAMGKLKNPFKFYLNNVPVKLIMGAILTPIAPLLHNDDWVPALENSDPMHTESQATVLRTKKDKECCH